MASSSTSSSGRQRKRLDLSLIFCPDCKWRKVMELTSHTLGNPDKKGKGKAQNCSEFYLWKDDYVQYLKEYHGYKPEIGEGGGTIVAGMQHRGGRTMEAARTETIADEEIGF